MTTVEACIQEIPPDFSGTHDLALREVQATAEDYLAAVGKIEADCPEGWRVLYVRTVDSPTAGDVDVTSEPGSTATG